MLNGCHLINRMPASVLNKKSPFSYLFPNKTSFSMTPRVFGCTCFVQDLSPMLDKLSSRCIKCIFVGNFRTQKEYRCYNPSTRKYLVSADVTFFESVPYFSQQVPITISRLFLHHQLCHCLYLLLLFLCPYLQQKVKIHLHQSQYGISEMSTLIAQRFLPLNLFRLIPLR